jgi:hypothetical protein
VALQCTTRESEIDANITLEALEALLAKNIEFGEVVGDVPDLTNAVYPQERYPSLSYDERAAQMDDDIGGAIEALEPRLARTWRILLRRDPEFYYVQREQLYQEVQEIFGVKRRAAGSRKWKAHLIKELAFALYQRITQPRQ